MKCFLNNKLGEGHIDTGVKIIIVVVIGALILSGLYFLFASDGGILDRLNEEVEGMMDYTQNLRYERYYNEASAKYELRYSYDGKHWHTPDMPTYSATATVYEIMSNNSETTPIEAALIQEGTIYHVLTSVDGGITWSEQLTFTATTITHCYYGTSDRLPNTSGSHVGEKFVIRFSNKGMYTMRSDGTKWVLPEWTDLMPF